MYGGVRGQKRIIHVGYSTILRICHWEEMPFRGVQKMDRSTIIIFSYP